MSISPEIKAKNIYLKKTKTQKPHWKKPDEQSVFQILNCPQRSSLRNPPALNFNVALFVVVMVAVVEFIRCLLSESASINIYDSILQVKQEGLFCLPTDRV